MQQTGTFTSNDIGTWTWYATISVNGVVLQSFSTIFAVLALPGDSGGNPQTDQVLIAADGFPPATLAKLSSWMNFLNQGFVLADVFSPVIMLRDVKVSVSTDTTYYTAAPDHIFMQSVITTGSTTTEGGDFWALCREIAHTRNLPFLFGSYFEESWATAECQQVYMTIAKHFPQAFGTSVPTFGTNGHLLDAYGDRKAVVYGTPLVYSFGVNDTGSALLDVYSERLGSLGTMQHAINFAEYATVGDQAANLDGLAQSLGVTNVEGVKPSVLFQRNAINFGTAPDGVTYLGTQESFSFPGIAGKGSSYMLNCIQYQNGTPVRQSCIVPWMITDSSNRTLFSGTTTTPTTINGFTDFFFKGTVTLPEGAYHFTATANDASGHASTDPNLFSEDVFAVVDSSRTLNAGDLVVVANGKDGKFGNIGSCNDLTLVSPASASISGSGSLCFVTNVPKRLAGGFEDVTLRGYGFTTTFVPSSTSASKRNFKHLDQPALVQGANDITGKTVTAVVTGETLILKGWGFTANDASMAMPMRSLHNTPRRALAAMPVASVTSDAAPVASPRPPRFGPSPPTSGCKGTELSDQGRSEVWFTQNGIVLKATILFCADNQMEVFVPAGLTPGATVNISVVVNGTQGLNALTLPVTK